MAALATGACKSADAVRLDYGQLFVVGDRFLIVGQTPAKLTGQHQLGRIALLGKDAAIKHKLDERTTFKVQGITDGVVWVTRSTATGDVGAYALDTLKPMAGISEAIAGHPVLSNTYQVKGLHQDAVVLEGPNAKLYALDASGGIEKLPEGAEIVEPPRVDPSGQLRLPLEPPPKNAPGGKQLLEELDNPSLFRDSATLLGADTSDSLVLHTAYAAGTATPMISRADASGARTWSVSLADLAAPVGIKDADIALVAVARTDEALWLLVRASKMVRHQQEDYYEVEHDLVRIDPATGKVGASQTVR